MRGFTLRKNNQNQSSLLLHLFFPLVVRQFQLPWRRREISCFFAYLITLITFACPPFALAQSGDTLRITLDEVLSSASTGNADILISKLEVQRANSQLRAAKGGFLPTIGVDGQYVRNIKRPVFFLPPGEGFGGAASEEGTVIEAGFDNSFNMTAQGNVPLYNRELIASVNAAKRSVNLQEKAMDISEIEIRTQTTKAYYEVLLAQESLMVLYQSLENARRNFENIRNQFRQELVPEYDVIRADVQVENIRPDILQAQNDYESALLNLKLLSNIPPELPIVLEESLTDFYDTTAVAGLLREYSIEANPQLQQLIVRQELQEEQLAIQKAGYFPTLSAFGNYAWQAQANNFEFSEYFWVNTASVGLQLSVPVFQGFTRQRGVEQARIDLEQSQIQEEYQRKALTVQAQNSLNRIQRAKKSLETQQRNISQAERGYHIARVSYDSGVGTLIDVNDAELALTQARLNQLQVIYEFLNALADFNQLTGNGITN